MIRRCDEIADLLFTNWDKYYSGNVRWICEYDALLTIREYGSTLYVGMAPKKNGRPYISIASDELKSLVIYADRF